MNQSQLKSILRDVLAQLRNSDLANGRDQHQGDFDDETALLGHILDSVLLVIYLSRVESALRDHKVTIDLASEKAFSQKYSPFSNINSLSLFIAQEIDSEAE